jgi:hypothetical protein
MPAADGLSLHTRSLDPYRGRRRPSALHLRGPLGGRQTPRRAGRAVYPPVAALASTTNGPPRTRGRAVVACDQVAYRLAASASRSNSRLACAHVRRTCTYGAPVRVPRVSTGNGSTSAGPHSTVSARADGRL